MVREKLYKELTYNNKYNNIMCDNNNMKTIKYKDFTNAHSYAANIDISEWPTKNAVEVVLKCAKNNNKGYHEWLDYSMRVKPYYDIDIFIPAKKLVGTDSLLGETINMVRFEVLEVLNKLYPDGDIAIASSHGEKEKVKTVNKIKEKEIGVAISFHFVVNNYDCSIEELKDFNEKNNLYNINFQNKNNIISKKEIKMFDNAVYTDGRNMRMLFSYKPGDKRQKIPDTYTDKLYWSKHIIQSIGDINYHKKPLPKPSPPSTPPQSPKAISMELKVEEDKEEIIEKADEDEDLPAFQAFKKQYNLTELQKILDLCTNEDCFEYETWTKIGMSLHNITEGDEVGFGLYNEYSKQHEGYDGEVDLKKKWLSFGKKKSGNKVGLTYLRNLKEKYEPQCNQKLATIWLNGYKKNKSVNQAVSVVNLEMNNRLIFVKETGNYIILDKKIVRKDNGDLISKPCWYLKNQTGAKDHFVKEISTIEYKDMAGDTKDYKLDPFKSWCHWDNRKEVRAIGFDPRENPNPDLFNLWCGFNMKKEAVEHYEEDEALPILDHIKELWCNNDENSYEYILNYFAHIIQKPHIKTGVLLALKSKQGGGKGIILDKLAQIIGDDHYCQNSNANFLFGNFNGQLEGKIICNLDEAFWGGDKNLEGVIKNKITEKRQTINKKNKENYQIDDYVNYIITTNNDWFAGISEDDRRYYCLELNNKLSGRMTKNTYKTVQPVLDAPAEAFAKILYNRDISEFKPRIFKKTKLLQEQVERNWNSVKVWYNSVMKEGGFTIGEKFVEWGELETGWDYDGDTNKGGVKIKNRAGVKKTAYCKEWLFNIYNSHSADGRKFSSSALFRDLSQNCMGQLYTDHKIQVKGVRRPHIIMPSLEEAREQWNQQQEYDYEYSQEDEWELDEE